MGVANSVIMFSIKNWLPPLALKEREGISR